MSLEFSLTQGYHSLKIFIAVHFTSNCAFCDGRSLRNFIKINVYKPTKIYVGCFILILHTNR